MKYRKFGKLDWEVSALGFGAMRLPLLNRKDPAQIDRKESIKMIRHGIDQGINYIDTAYPYHGEQSEILVGEALKDGYRAKVKVATKLPSWMVTCKEDLDRYLNEQLERMQTDHIEFYLLHSLNNIYWPKLREVDVLSWAQKAMDDGRIGHLGFSFHDEFSVFKEIVDATDLWTFCQIQYNYMDINFQAGTAGLKYAAEKGLAVVVMEPVRGGNLSKQPPASVQALWDSAPVKRTPADWALQWVWNHPEVAVSLSGMSSYQQVEENLASADRCAANILSAEELALVDQVRAEYRKLSPIPCTACKYCVPCPQKVDIPRVLGLYNDAVLYQEPAMFRMRYGQVPKKNRANNCVDCGECEGKCPQQIQIMDWLKKGHELLGPKPAA